MQLVRSRKLVIRKSFGIDAFRLDRIVSPAGQSVAFLIVLRQADRTRTDGRHPFPTFSRWKSKCMPSAAGGKQEEIAPWTGVKDNGSIRTC